MLNDRFASAGLRAILRGFGEVRSGGSYLSQNDLRLHFGLGDRAKVDRVEVTWPGGAKQVETAVGGDRVVAVREK